DFHKTDRHAEILAALKTILGQDRAEWSVPVAVAIPVEMIESWLLLIACGGQAHELPRFARQDSERARRFHHPTPPPPQLKDRRDSVRAEEGFLDKDEWVLHLIFNKLEPVDLAKRSPSFGLFKQWLDSWPRASRVN